MSDIITVIKSMERELHNLKASKIINLSMLYYREELLTVNVPDGKYLQIVCAPHSTDTKPLADGKLQLGTVIDDIDYEYTGDGRLLINYYIDGNPQWIARVRVCGVNLGSVTYNLVMPS